MARHIRILASTLAVVVVVGCVQREGVTSTGSDAASSTGGQESGDTGWTGEGQGPGSPGGSTGSTGAGGLDEGGPGSFTTGDGASTFAEPGSPTDETGWDETGWDEAGEEERCEDVLPEGNPAPADANAICDVHGEYRSCVDDPEKTQFCDLDRGADGWGPCLGTYECIPGDLVVCFFCDPDFGTWSTPCYLDAGIPTFNSEDCSTPLVLSFDDRPVEFVTSTGYFRMTARDDCASTDWPTAATPWLAMDRDGNGSIDGGHELFGSGTVMGATWAGDGFAALAGLDSDGDGWITPGDARWAELLLWEDHDQDRRSGPWELEALASRGVVAIDLGYSRPASRCDARGNCEAERASVSLRGPGFAEVIDVRLACQ